LGSCLTNKYSEGYPKHRYYGGNEFIDEIEILCQQRALKAFGVSEKEWGVNVQALSGTPANLAALLGLMEPGETVMGLDLPSGGHLSHGYQTEKKKISNVAVIFKSCCYKINKDTGLFDFEEIRRVAEENKPKVIICGYSAYSRDIDYKAFREIADSVGAYLLADVAHIAGLIASKLMNSPFEYADVVTTTTHKSLRGPRGALIFYKMDERNLKEKIDFSVFPGTQGGPHNNIIAGIATQLKEVATDDFKAYSKQIIANAQQLGKSLMEKGYKIISDGTDNHMILLDLRPNQLTGNKVEKAFDAANLTANKNTVVGDKSALTPGGIRLGTPALTSRGLVEKDMQVVADFIDRIIQECLVIQSQKGSKLKDFLEGLETNEVLIQIRKEVIDFSKQFYLPASNNSS